ncbi:hypothetical protein ACTFIY_002926 [Dictyostelium cf. discoideum]
MNLFSDNILEFLIECWKYDSNKFYPFIISPLNKWNHLVISSPDDRVAISIDTFFEDISRNNNSIKLYQHNDENDKNNLYLIKKEFDNSSHCYHFQMYPNEYQY